MPRVSGTSAVEGRLIDWAIVQPDDEWRVPAGWLTDVQVATELAAIERRRARDTAREADLILRLADLRPDADDPAPGTRGARRRDGRSDAELPGVSEFFPAELGHALNLGRGTAAFRARRAFTWAVNLPATFAALHAGDLDERRAGVLADVLQHTGPALARAVEAAVLPEAAELSLAELRRRALATLAELDAAAVAVRHEEAKKTAAVRNYETGDGMAVLAGDMTVDQAAACQAMLTALARMAKADGDDRPLDAIRAEIMTMLIMRPADHGLPGGISVALKVTATLSSLEGRSATAGEVNGSAVTAAQLRDLLRRVGALGLTAPEGGSLEFAVTDGNGRLLATLTPSELARLATKGCSEHPDEAGCGCAVAGMPSSTDRYEPSDSQHRFVDTRDRRCRMPNCGQRAGWADHDHVVPHAEGGETTCTNLCCLCRSHHRLKTFARGWTFRMDPDGTLNVTSPSGVTRTTRPPGLRPPESPPDPPTPDPPPF